MTASFRSLWLAILGSMIAGGVAGAQQRDALRGVVIDRAADKALAGARIVASSGASTTTDPTGAFTLALGSGGDLTLRVIRIGYRPVDLAVPVGASRLTIAMDPAAVELQTIVSLATRRAQAGTDVAIPVAVLSRDDIVASGALGLDALLREVPGLQQSIEPPARSALQIRGIGGSRVLVLIDGEPVPGALLEDRDLSRISLAAVEQVEVVKGPLAAIHGSEALGGVINVVTRAPEGPFALRALVGGGTTGRRNAMVEASQGGGLAWRLTAAHRSVDQIATQVPRPDALQRVWNVDGTVQSELGSTATIKVSASALRERQRWPVDGSINAFNDNTAWSAWIEGQRARDTRVLRARVSLHEFSHQYREAAGEVPFAGTGAPIQRERAGRLLLTGTTPIGMNQVLDVGLEASTRRVAAPDRLEHGTLDDHGLDLWVQDSWHSGQGMLTGALRQSLSSRWGSTLTPAFTAAVEPMLALRLHGSVARGFRGPSFKESGWSFSNASAGYLVEGNPDLVPEHSWQYTIGAAWQPHGTTRVDFELFRNDLRNLIDLRFVGNNPAGLQRFQPRNVMRAHTQGLDLSISHRLGAVTLEGAWAWLVTRDESTGSPLPDRVPHTLSVVGRAPMGSVDFTLTGHWSAAVPAAAGSAGGRDARLAWDAAARWNIGAAVEVQAGIDNVFDQVPNGWQGPIGRALRIAVQTSWND